MAIRTLPDINYIREILDYDAETGVFTWRSRPKEHFRTQAVLVRWGILFAGRRAGTIDGGGYIRIRINNEYYRAHRLVWLLARGHPIPVEIDHINGNKADNRAENLRAATKVENGANSRMRADNKTGFKGVFRIKSGRYRAKIDINRQQIHVGYFKTLKEAAEARKEAAERIHGPFARHT